MNPESASIAVGRNAMATRFEVYLPGKNLAHLRAAAEEALDEIERLDGQLSVHSLGSEMSRLNAWAAKRPVKVDRSLFGLLQHARRLSLETGGAFDITVGPLLRCWGFWGGNGHPAEPQALKVARDCVGWQHIRLDEEQGTVQFDHPGVELDLGAIGKGYAIDRALELLREAGVTSGVVDGGNSTIGVIGAPPGRPAWEVFLPRPDHGQALHRQALASPPAVEVTDLKAGSAKSIVAAQAQENPLAVIALRDATLSVSAVWGRSFIEAGQVRGHVLDPRVGRPIRGACLAAVVLPSATESDAFSTALLVDGSPGQRRLGMLRPGMRTWIVSPGDAPDESGWKITALESER